MSSSKKDRPVIAMDAPPELTEFVDAVEVVHREHRVDPVRAGDEFIFAYGGNGYVVILSESVFGGLVELATPVGALRVEPDAAGAISVALVDPNNRAPASVLLSDGARQLLRYYARRYWSV
jgi:hypothetical protein